MTGSSGPCLLMYPPAVSGFMLNITLGTSPLIEVNILPIEKREEPVTIDFANPEESPDYFNDLYYFMAKGWDVTNGLLTEGWGKANGGASHKHVYMQDGLLALEACMEIFMMAARRDLKKMVP